MDFTDIMRVQAQLRGAFWSDIHLRLAIRGPERTEPTVWEREFDFASAHSLPISTHIAVSAQLKEKRALQQLARRGLLSSTVQLVHATHADQRDLESIRATGASICITPLTEMRVGYGLPSVAALHQAKIPVTLGVDTVVLGGNANPFLLMQTCLNLAIATTRNEQAITARDVLKWATQGAAESMGLGDQIGSLTVGKRADLIMVNARNVGMFPVIDPIASIVQSAASADGDTVIAGGKILKQNGRLVGVDLVSLERQAAAGALKLVGP